MKIDGRHIIAEEGKVFARKQTGEIFGTEINLGYSHYIGGVLQDPPHYDEPDDFEEIDMPEGYLRDISEPSAPEETIIPEE